MCLKVKWKSGNIYAVRCVFVTKSVPNVFVNGEHIGGEDEFDDLGVERIKRMIGQN